MYGNPVGMAAETVFMANLKEPVELPGVFKDEKFKEATGASSTPAYYGIVFTTDSMDDVTNTATCDHDKYVDTTTTIINDFVAATLKEFYEYT
ncbi:MAG: hypothetical protein ACJA08_002607 [Cyclobacteriaceae bacterium]